MIHFICPSHTRTHARSRTHTHQICQIASRNSNNRNSIKCCCCWCWRTKCVGGPYQMIQSMKHTLTHVQPTRKFVLFVLLNLILCLHKGLYSINSCSIHSSNRTPIYTIRALYSVCPNTRSFRRQSTLWHCVRVRKYDIEWSDCERSSGDWMKMEISPSITCLLTTPMKFFCSVYIAYCMKFKERQAWMNTRTHTENERERENENEWCLLKDWLGNL